MKTSVGIATRAVARRLATMAMWLATSVAVLAASPGPTAAPGGDPRSSGQGPGLVGDPATALLAVLAIGLGTLAITLAYIRLTADRPRRPQ